MTPLLVVVIVVIMCAIFFFLALAASLLAALVFWYAPALEGTILALTASDIAWTLRQMPIYPAWWPGHEGQPPKKKLVMLAINPVEKPEYFCGFAPTRRAILTPDRNGGLKLDLSDRFIIEKLIRRLEDEAHEVFIVFVETARPGMQKILPSSRYTKRGLKWYDMRPPINLPVGHCKVPSSPKPAYFLLTRRSGTISPRLR
jgi:hypothetical protein